MNIPEKFVRKSDGSVVLQACKNSDEYALKQKSFEQKSATGLREVSGVEEVCELAAEAGRRTKELLASSPKRTIAYLNDMGSTQALSFQPMDGAFEHIELEVVKSIEVSWAEAQRISDIPEVHECIVNFVEDQTGDNAVFMVQEIIKAANSTDDELRKEQTLPEIPNALSTGHKLVEKYDGLWKAAKELVSFLEQQKLNMSNGHKANTYMHLMYDIQTELDKDRV